MGEMAFPSWSLPVEYETTAGHGLNGFSQIGMRLEYTTHFQMPIRSCCPSAKTIEIRVIRDHSFTFALKTIRSLDP